MPSVRELLDRKAAAAGGGNQNRQKNPSGHGKGKWHDKASLRKYRAKRDAKRRG